MLRLYLYEDFFMIYIENDCSHSLNRFSIAFLFVTVHLVRLANIDRLVFLCEYILRHVITGRFARITRALREPDPIVANMLGDIRHALMLCCAYCVRPEEQTPH